MYKPCAIFWRQDQGISWYPRLLVVDGNLRSLAYFPSKPQVVWSREVVRHPWPAKKSSTQTRNAAACCARQRQQRLVGHCHLVIEPFLILQDMVHEQQTIDWDDTYSVSDCIHHDQSGTQRTSRSYLWLPPIPSVLPSDQSTPWCTERGCQVSQDRIVLSQDHHILGELCIQKGIADIKLARTCLRFACAAKNNLMRCVVCVGR